MIITQLKPADEILDTLKDARSIFLVGCGECATTCKTGGQAQLDAMKAFFETQGKTVAGMCIPKAPCIVSQIKLELSTHISRARQADTLAVCACGLGVQSVKEGVRWDVAVVPLCDTICTASVDVRGNFSERCLACGECLLAQTGGYCPTALCAKGLLNGPCGGMKRGKCEMDKDRDCIWVVIYRELAVRDSLKRMREIRGPKNHKKSARPHYVTAG